MLITALVLLGVFAFIWVTARFWIQWWWFESVGYQTALTTRYTSGALAFLVASLLVGGFFAANWNLALRRGDSVGRSARLASSRILRWLLWSSKQSATSSASRRMCVFSQVLYLQTARCSTPPGTWKSA